MTNTTGNISDEVLRLELQRLQSWVTEYLDNAADCDKRAAAIERAGGNQGPAIRYRHQAAESRRCAATYQRVASEIENLLKTALAA